MWPVVFGVLAAVTLSSSWRHESLRAIGIMLALGYCVSHFVTYMFLANMMFFETRVLVYSFIEVGVGSIAFMLYMCGGSRALIAVVAFAMASICANLAILVVTPPNLTPPLETRHLWNLVTNVCFAMECLVVSLKAAADRDRDRRYDRRPSHARLLVARDADPWTPKAD